jgi:hypothetical protein
MEISNCYYCNYDSKILYVIFVLSVLLNQLPRIMRININSSYKAGNKS